MLFLSSRSSETSRENPYGANGYFTQYLEKGMKGAADTDRNRIVEAKEIFTYVAQKVAQATHDKQLEPQAQIDRPSVHRASSRAALQPDRSPLGASRANPHSLIGAQFCRFLPFRHARRAFHPLKGKSFGGHGLSPYLCSRNQ